MSWNVNLVEWAAITIVGGFLLASWVIVTWSAGHAIGVRIANWMLRRVRTR